MAFNSGTTQAQGNAISFTDIAALDAPTEYTVSFWIKLYNTPGVNYFFISKKQSGAFDGWCLYVKATTGEVGVQHYGGGASNTVTSNTGLTAGTWQQVVLSWDGANANFFLNGVADGTPALVRVPGLNAQPFTLLNISDPGANLGLACELAHVFWWDKAVSVTAVTTIYGGKITQTADLQFWHGCWDKSQKDNIAEGAPTVTGTVTETECTIRGVPNPGLVDNDTLPPAIKPVVVNDTETITETNRQTKNQMGDDTMSILDGDNNALWDPDGTITDTVTDGVTTTVWTKKFPPFIRRTQWTEA